MQTSASLTFGRSLETSSLATRAAAVVIGSLLIAAAAQITVPMVPVPMTMQTFAVLAIAMLYGPRLAAMTLLTYIAEGAVGLPVFAGGLNGAMVVAKFSTLGYIAGFLAMSVVAGWIASTGAGVVRAALATLAGSVVMYALGVAWLAYVLGGDVGKAVTLGLVPFLIGDVVKAALAIAVRETLGRVSLSRG